MRSKRREVTLKASRIEEFVRDGETYHKIICPYCRKVMIFSLKSHLYPKGYNMRCVSCKEPFKKFLRQLQKE